MNEMHERILVSVQLVRQFQAILKCFVRFAGDEQRTTEAMVRRVTIHC